MVQGNMEQKPPRITIVTPSYNQGEFIEETILSVLNQNYPFLEYIIMDGGSTDNSVDIIKKYEDKLSFWVSNPDGGQADAIDRGFKMATGDIFAYINSDDIYLPNAFWIIAEIFMSNPSSQWVVGEGYCIDQNGQFINRKKYEPVTFMNMLFLEDCVMQPTAFWRRDLYFAVGGIDPRYKFSFDYDLFLKFCKKSRPISVHHDIALFRIHSQSKTTTIHDVSVKEDHEIRKKNILEGKNPIKCLIYLIFGKFYKLIYFSTKILPRRVWKKNPEKERIP
jgi:glycosyltransferase involved in cell wall biosynthesis